MEPTANYRKITRKGDKKVHKCVVKIPDATRPKGYRTEQHGFYTRDEAYIEVFRQRDLIRAGVYDPKQYTFGEAVERYITVRPLKEITRRSYRFRMKRYFGQFYDMPLRDVGQMRAEITDILKVTPDPSASRSIITRTFNLAMAEGNLTEAHRMGELEIERQQSRTIPPIPHTAEQLNIILANIPDDLKLLVLLGRSCGLRIGEALALETDAIHDGYLAVKRGTSGGIDGLPKKRYRGFTPRLVPIPYWLEPIITDHIARYAVDGVLFPTGRTKQASKRSKYITAESFRKTHFRPAVAAAGLPWNEEDKDLNFGTHQLRKNYAEQWRAEHVSMGLAWIDVMQFMGHKNLTADSYSGQPMETIIKGRNLSDPRIITEDS